MGSGPVLTLRAGRALGDERDPGELDSVLSERSREAKPRPRHCLKVATSPRPPTSTPWVPPAVSWGPQRLRAPRNDREPQAAEIQKLISRD